MKVMTSKLKLFELTQPIGTFYIGKINSNNLVNSFYVRRRSNGEGIQRFASSKRIQDIMEYCKDPDAAFPTPIIVAVDSTKYNLSSDYTLEYEETNDVFEVIDGQHRVLGIRDAKSNFGFECELLVVVMFDLTEEEKAYVFSTINSNQAKVDKSLIYDLFDLSTERSPYKTCHYIARILNSSENSPFYNSLKMLGRKENENNTLSQGTFVNGLIKLISNNPQKDMVDIKNNIPIKNDNLPLRKLFIDKQDDIILKIIQNYFNGVKDAFWDEWGPNNYILKKTTGYLGLIKAFSYFYELGLENKTLSRMFFSELFKKINCNLKKKEIILTAENFPPGETGQNKFKQILIDAFIDTK